MFDKTNKHLTKPQVKVLKLTLNLEFIKTKVEFFEIPVKV